MEWGVVCTAKAPLPQLLAFVAWHRHAGAARIWVHLDDADAVSAGVLNQIEGVTAVLCDAPYWAAKGNRPKPQEQRQAYNARRVYADCSLPVLAHVDVDEYLYPLDPERSIADVLADWTGDTPFLRVAPAEALHDPALPDDIFTARQFRLPFPRGMAEAEKRAVLGRYALMLPHNMLSHRVGKSFFRTGIDGLTVRLHAASFGKDAKPINVPVNPEIVVLHFHAQDRAAWRAALDHRVTDGAYRFNEPLAAHLGGASEAEIDAFYEATQVATPELVAALESRGLLIEADLRLREKVDALF